MPANKCRQSDGVGKSAFYNYHGKNGFRQESVIDAISKGKFWYLYGLRILSYKLLSILHKAKIVIWI